MSNSLGCGTVKFAVSDMNSMERNETKSN